MTDYHVSLLDCVRCTSVLMSVISAQLERRGRRSTGLYITMPGSQCYVHFNAQIRHNSYQVEVYSRLLLALSIPIHPHISHNDCLVELIKVITSTQYNYALWSLLRPPKSSRGVLPTTNLLLTCYTLHVHFWLPLQVEFLPTS